jgi:hypothetical protein
MFKLILHIIIGFFIVRFIRAIVGTDNKKQNQNYRNVNSDTNTKSTKYDSGEYIDYDEVK